MAGLWLSLLLLLQAPAPDPLKTVDFGRGFNSAPAPTFDKGYLLFAIRPNRIEVWGPDGRERFSAAVENPPLASIYSAAVDSDGSVAAGIAFAGAQGATGGIVHFDPSGRQTRITDTGRYMPSHLCFDRNHSLWTFGWQRAPGAHEDPADYMMFRKYSASGIEAGRFGPRSMFPKGLAPGSPQLGLWRIRAADDRVGALAYSGNTSVNKVWIELDLDGHLIGKWPVGAEMYGGLAFTSDARLFRLVPAGDRPHLECFDRSAAVWKPAGPSPVRGALLGAQGEDLVFSRDEGVVALWWAKAP